MNEAQRAAALRLIEFETLPRRLLDIACRVRVNECLFHDDEFVDDASHALKEAIDLLRELAAEPVVNQQMTTEPVQEPLFWVRLRSDGGYEGPIAHSAIEEVRRQSGAWTPLYAAPQRQPLTDEQIRRIVVEASTGSAIKRDGSTSMRIARAIERAHAITGETT